MTLSGKLDSKENQEIFNTTGTYYIVESGQRITVPKLKHPMLFNNIDITCIFFFVIRDAISRKDVNPNATCIIFSNGEYGIASSLNSVENSAIVEIIILIFFRENTQPLGLKSGTKTVIVRTGHDNVNIVIPWDEPLVPNSTNQGAVRERIPDPVIQAEIMYFLKNLEALCLNILKSQYFHFVEST